MRFIALVTCRRQREVALKILPRSEELTPNRLQGFIREARVLSLLSHPNIAVIHGVDEFHFGPALILEFVKGQTLADRIANGIMPLIHIVEHRLAACGRARGGA